MHASPADSVSMGLRTILPLFNLIIRFENLGPDLVRKMPSHVEKIFHDDIHGKIFHFFSAKMQKNVDKNFCMSTFVNQQKFFY